MHVSGTGLESASGADIAAAFSHRLIVGRGITLQFARRIDPDAAGDTTPAALAGSAAWRTRCRRSPPSPADVALPRRRSEEHTSELQSLMRISYAVFCLKKKKNRIYCSPHCLLCSYRLDSTVLLLHRRQ